MVAAAEPKIARRHKPVPKGSTLLKIDLFTRSQAHNLYVVRQLGAQEVASQTGLSLKQVYQLAQREGWTKTRIAIKEKAKQALSARAEADIGEYVDAVAIKSKVLGLGTLDEAISELKGGGEFKAKNLQALSVAARNFNGIYREAKRLDATEGGNANGNTTNVALFFLPSAAVAPRNVTPNTQAASAALPAPALDIVTTPSASVASPAIPNP